MPSHNRSAPPQGVIPVLAYGDVREAVDWLTRVFGFTEKVQIGDHRSDSQAGTAPYRRRRHLRASRPAPAEGVTHSTMVRVATSTRIIRRAAAEGRRS